MQSQRTLPPARSTRSARWPIANRGAQPMPRIPWSSRTSASWPARNSLRSIQRWPLSCGTYWRGSSQIGHAGRRLRRTAGTASRTRSRPTWSYRVADEQRDALDVRRVREHVDRARAHEAVAVVVARGASGRRRASSGCTRRRRRAARRSRRAASAPCPRGRRAAGRRRRRPGRPPARAGPQRLADVAGEERGVADRVQLLVLDRAGDRLLGDLDPPHRQRVARQRRGRSCRCRSRGRRPSRRRSSAAYSRASSYSRSAISRVRLQERVRPHAEAQAADLLLDRVLAPEELASAGSSPPPACR